MIKFYIIEYINKINGKPTTLELVETLDDAILYIKEHHLMMNRIYKVWYSNLKWRSKSKPILDEVKINSEIDLFTSPKTKTEYLPTKHFVVSYWYDETLKDNYVIKGREIYNIYELIFENKTKKEIENEF